MKLSKRGQKGRRFQAKNTEAELLVGSSKARRPLMNFWIIRVEFRKCVLETVPKGSAAIANEVLMEKETSPNGECSVRVHSALASEIRLSFRAIASSLTSNALASVAAVRVVFRSGSNSRSGMRSKEAQTSASMLYLAISRTVQWLSGGCFIRIWEISCASEKRRR